MVLWSVRFITLRVSGAAGSHSFIWGQQSRCAGVHAKCNQSSDNLNVNTTVILSKVLSVVQTGNFLRGNPNTFFKMPIFKWSWEKQEVQFHSTPPVFYCKDGHIKELWHYSSIGQMLQACVPYVVHRSKIRVFLPLNFTKAQIKVCILHSAPGKVVLPPQTSGRYDKTFRPIFDVMSLRARGTMTTTPHTPHISGTARYEYCNNRLAATLCFFWSALGSLPCWRDEFKLVQDGRTQPSARWIMSRDCGEFSFFCICRDGVNIFT